MVMKTNSVRANLILSCAIVSLLNLFSCGSGGSGAPGPDYGPISYLYVDATRGNDATGNGLYGTPYKTITKGLLSAKAGNTVSVATGTYDSALGEVFPLQLIPGTTLRGSGSVAPVINGAGSYASPSLGATYFVAVLCADNSTLLGFQISTINGVGIWCEGTNMRPWLMNNSIINNDYGIVIAGDAQPQIYYNLLSQNNYSGIEMFDQSMPRIVNNTITNNSSGIAVRNQSQPFIGTANDPGGNTITGNVNCDLLNTTNNQIFAIGNVWDDNVYLFSVSTTCSNGANVANLGLGFVIYQNVPSSDSPVFPGSTLINLSAPAEGALLTTNLPHFTWTRTDKQMVFLSVSNKPISLQGKTVANTEDIVWVWYSGLGRGLEGDVNFDDGVNIINGDLNSGMPPTPLARGKTYYWAVWAWDTEGLSITNSSAQYYFTITN